MNASGLFLVVWVALAMSAELAQAQTLSERATAPVAFASVQGAGLDFARLTLIFDAARVRIQDVLAPRASRAWQSPKPAAESRVRLVIGPDPSGPRLSALPAPPAPVLPDPVVATPAYRRTFDALLASPATDRYDDLILKYARAYDLDPRLLKAIVAAESQFVFSAVSPRGARGLMQVMPSTAREMGVVGSLRDPEFNIQAGAAYVARLFSSAWRRYKLKGVRFHNAPLWLKQRVIAAYNAGPRFLFRDGGWYRETRDYVRKVLLYYQSAVTEFRRPPESLLGLPALPFGPSQGTLY